MAFCLAFLAGRLFLRTFFGDLRVIERQVCRMIVLLFFADMGTIAEVMGQTPAIQS